MEDAEYFELFGFNDEDGVQIINETFPHKLYRMLFEVERKGQEDIASFFPHGKAFIVKDAKRFVGTFDMVSQNELNSVYFFVREYASISHVLSYSQRK